MSTPLFHELQTQFPKAEIDGLVLSKGAQQILLGNPRVQKTFQHDFLKASKLSSLVRCWKLRGKHYDLSVNTHTQGRREYRVISRLIGAQVRLSHQYENESWLDRLLVTHSIPQDYTLHSMDNNLRLLRLIGREPRLPQHQYEVFLSKSEKDWATDWLQENPVGTQKLLGIHIGSGGTQNLALRRWPLAHYVAFLKELPRRYPTLQPVLFGGPEEATDLAELRAAGCQFLEVKSTNLRQAIALVNHCDTFLSVDTVFMHIAAAVRVPHQFVIETPTLNPTVYPRRNDWILIPNSAVAGRHLDFYRYDGRAIAGTAAELRNMMKRVTVESVLEAMGKAAAAVRDSPIID